MNTPINVVYRYCCEDEIKNLLNNGKLTSLSYDYLSFSKIDNPIDFGTTLKGEYKVTYNKDILDSEGGIDIEYTAEFMNEHPNICSHVTGWESENHYKAATMEPFAFEDYLNDCHVDEFEYVINEITLQTGLIVSIEKSPYFPGESNLLYNINDFEYLTIS